MNELQVASIKWQKFMCIWWTYSVGSRLYDIVNCQPPSPNHHSSFQSFSDWKKRTTNYYIEWCEWWKCTFSTKIWCNSILIINGHQCALGHQLTSRYKCYESLLICWDVSGVLVSNYWIVHAMIWLKNTQWPMPNIRMLNVHMTSLIFVNMFWVPWYWHKMFVCLCVRCVCEVWALLVWVAIGKQARSPFRCYFSIGIYCFT